MNIPRNKRPLLLALGLAILCAAGGIGIAALHAETEEPGATYGYLKLFNEVLARVRDSYVESVPETDLYRGAYDGLLAALDGECEYLTAADYKEIKGTKSSEDADPGIFLTRKEGVLFVAAVLPGSDAQAKGLRVGDQIRRIGDRAGRELTLTLAERALKGPAGSTILVAISRRDEPRREDLEVTRRKLALPMPKLDAPQDSVAVVRIPSFGPGSGKALGSIVDRLNKDHAKRVIFDLRGNAWGDIDEAVRAASILVGDGIVARLKDRKGEERILKGTGSKASFDGDVLLLTDPGTSHAAEMFVAALVDAGVARQAGETTLGHGGEQEILPLDNGDYLSLTVRKYVSPAGKSWHGSGLTPGVAIPADGSVAFKDRADRQLKKAVEWLRDHPEEAKAA